MGLLDEIGKSIGIGGAAQTGLGGAQPALMQAVMGLLGGGGLQGLVNSFQQKGLGDIMGSWISTGKNLPIAPDQVAHALGPDKLGQMAKQVGLDPSALAGQLSGLLPSVVDKLTPNGALPDASALQGGLGDLLKKLT